MFIHTWKKYLPVIAILMKRSGNGEQTLSMNHTDFERAAGGKKVKYSFSSVFVNNGRPDGMVKHTPIVKEFLQILQENELTRLMLKEQQFEFALNNDFKLLIRNNTSSSDPLVDVLPESNDKTIDNKSEE